VENKVQKADASRFVSSRFDCGHVVHSKVVYGHTGDFVQAPFAPRRLVVRI
jgi:hypothetical protein